MKGEDSKKEKRSVFPISLSLCPLLTPLCTSQSPRKSNDNFSAHFKSKSTISTCKILQTPNYKAQTFKASANIITRLSYCCCCLQIMQLRLRVEFGAIFVTRQLIVTLDSICNSMFYSWQCQNFESTCYINPGSTCLSP